jgi:hypothetical protein
VLGTHYLKRLAEQLGQRADDLYLENLRLQQELERYKKATYGPRADPRWTTRSANGKH